MIISWDLQAWEDYQYWVNSDKKKAKRINAIIKDITRNPKSGIGKPEKLKKTNGLWSRRIDRANRIVYYVQNDQIIIISCKGHYD